MAGKIISHAESSENKNPVDCKWNAANRKATIVLDQGLI